MNLNNIPSQRLAHAIQAGVSAALKTLHDEETGAVSTAPARKGKDLRPAVAKAIDNRSKRYQSRK